MKTSQKFQLIYDYLETFQQEWGSEISDRSIRQGSTILRTLLIEGCIRDAWRQLVKPKSEPHIYAIELKKTPSIDYAIAGGGKFKYNGIDMNVSSTFSSRQATAQLPKKLISPNTSYKSFKLTEYLESISGYTPESTITRREIIQYFAHIMGGAHIGGLRRKVEKELYEKVAKLKSNLSPPFGYDGSDYISGVIRHL